ncbi:terminase small subunit [Paenibacillus sp. T2-29]
MAEEKHPGGRPLKFKSAEELQGKIDDYFESCYEEIWTRESDKDGKEAWAPLYDRHGNIEKRLVRPFTISGLAVFLETDRKTLLNYEDREEFFHTIKKAKARIENYTEEQLYNASAKNMTGIIFNLKNNYGWQDKQEINNNIGNQNGETFEVSHSKSLKNLSPEELAELERIISKTSDSE